MKKKKKRTCTIMDFLQLINALSDSAELRKELAVYLEGKGLLLKTDKRSRKCSPDSLCTPRKPFTEVLKKWNKNLYGKSDPFATLSVASYKEKNNGVGGNDCNK